MYEVEPTAVIGTPFSVSPTANEIEDESGMTVYNVRESSVEAASGVGSGARVGIEFVLQAVKITAVNINKIKYNFFMRLIVAVHDIERITFTASDADVFCRICQFTCPKLKFAVFL